MVSLLEILNYAGFREIWYPGYSVFGTPFRPSHKTSFFVCDNGSYWVEKGMKDPKGKPVDIWGDVIDFLIAVGASATRDEAIDWLNRFPNDNDIFIFKGLVENPKPTFDFSGCGNHNSGVKILLEFPLDDAFFLNSVFGQGIDFSVARYFLREGITVQGNIVKSKNRVLIFPNSFGGALSFSRHEIRAIGKQGYSYFKYGNYSQLAVFQSIELFLRMRSEGLRWHNEDEVILNHYFLFPSVLPLAEKYNCVIFFLHAGASTFEFVEKISRTKIKNKYIRIK